MIVSADGRWIATARPISMRRSQGDERMRKILELLILLLRALKLLLEILNR
ncbi:hypothetical protein [Azospirillum argentinense]|uniref:Uncharacterized protein n=2 Tax=Azospirillum TaxID=191 RepID=A0A5B0L2H3_9PROT|nr:hypothetical protein [Azospirillum argentinense]KAA1058489.1 hypothetical protein FH063_000689 [Azospirillum argentinense]